MRKWTMRVVGGFLILVALAYVGVCAWLRINEDRLAYTRSHPYVPPSPSLALKQQRVEFAERDGTKLFAWIVPSLPADTSNTWVLFFHGTGDNVSEHGAEYYEFRSMGFNVMAPEYPGYLDSPGTPSEPLVEGEAQAAYDYLRQTRHVRQKDIVVYGISLGSAIAIDLASRADVGTLIVCAGWPSGVAVGQKMFPFLPMGLLLRNRFESARKIGHVRSPDLVIHSSEDDRFPFAENGQKLYELAPSPKQLIRIRGKHGPETTNPVVNPDFFSGIATFLNTEAGFQVRRPLQSIASTIAATIDASGLEAGLAQYRSLRDGDSGRYGFQEPELDELGTYLLSRGKANEAAAVFELNAEQFPVSFKVYDSFGDAHVELGNHAEAIRRYRQALALFPGDGIYIRAKLDQLRGH